MPVPDNAPLKISEIESPKFKIELNGEVKSYDPFEVSDKVLRTKDVALHDAVLGAFGLSQNDFPHGSSPRNITLVLWTKLQEFMEGLESSKKYAELVQRNSSSAAK